jgi:hypothetical protein
VSIQAWLALAKGAQRGADSSPEPLAPRWKMYVTKPARRVVRVGELLLFSASPQQGPGGQHAAPPTL